MISPCHKVIPCSGCRESVISFALQTIDPASAVLLHSTCLRLSIPDAARSSARLIPHFVRAAGNRTRSTPTPWARTTGILQPALVESFCRDAGNRTRSLRTRSARTTGILHPEKRTPRCILKDSNLRPFECESNALAN